MPKTNEKQKIEPLNKQNDNIQESKEDERWPYSEEELEEGYSQAESGDSRPHIGFIEGFFLISFNAIGDLLELFDLTGVGMVIGLIVDFVNGPITVGWLWFRGIPMVSRNAIAQGIELVPGLDILPIRTTAIILTIITINHPEWMKKLGLAGEITQDILKAKGKKITKPE